MYPRLSLIAFAFLIGVTSADTGCGSSTDAPSTCSASVSSCPAGTPSYARDVSPIIRARCSPCHAPDGVEANRPYQTYDQIKRVQLGILFQVRACKMPPAGEGPLSDEEKATLLGWLFCDAPDN